MSYVMSRMLNCFVLKYDNAHFCCNIMWSFSHVVGPCHPFRKDPDLDYDVDSDEEWEEVIYDSFHIVDM